MDAAATNAVMERASAALADMRYIECERLCLEALAAARAVGDYDTYARILMPLQEARRQRRQIASDAPTRVFDRERLDPRGVLEAHERGGIMLICPPFELADEAAVRELAMERGLYVEVLALDHDRLRGAFELAMEREGDAALAAIPKNLPTEQRVDRIAEALHRIGDHEIAHQRLEDAARAAAHERAAAGG